MLLLLLTLFLCNTWIKCIFDHSSSIWNVWQWIPGHCQRLNDNEYKSKSTFLQLKPKKKNWKKLDKWTICLHGLWASNRTKKKKNKLKKRKMYEWFTTIAATNVKTNETMTIIVAINRFSANIFFSCLNGPIKKQVLYSINLWNIHKKTHTHTHKAIGQSVRVHAMKIKINRK